MGPSPEFTRRPTTADHDRSPERQTGVVCSYAIVRADGSYGPAFSSLDEAAEWALANLPVTTGVGYRVVDPRRPARSVLRRGERVLLPALHRDLCLHCLRRGRRRTERSLVVDDQHDRWRAADPRVDPRRDLPPSGEAASNAPSCRGRTRTIGCPITADHGAASRALCTRARFDACCCSCGGANPRCCCAGGGDVVGRVLRRHAE